MGAVAEGAGRLGMDAFLRLLVTGLRYQDPLRPVDEREFLVQLAQLAQVERLQALAQQVERLGRALEEMGRLSGYAAAAALIGRTARLQSGEELRVLGVAAGEGGLRLLLQGGREVGLADVQVLLEAR